MTHSFKSARRISQFRAPLMAALIVALGACDDASSYTADGSTDPGTALEAPDAGTDVGMALPVQEGDPAVDALAGTPAGGVSLASASFAGGIPFGMFHLPNEQFGSRFNGALRNIWPEYVRSNLDAIRSRGGKVALSLAGSERNFKDSDGHFSFSKWKAQIDRYKSIDLDSYARGGTLIGHYLIDEPNDPSNWSGRPVPPSTVEEMARYSKGIWPDVPTIVRAYPDYMDDWSGSYRYLDAAWAQYWTSKGNVYDFIESNVSKARGKGLALIVGLNVLDGSGWQTAPMSASQIRDLGSALLSSSYPCAFLSWQYDSGYLSSGSVRDAMDYLRNKAESRSFKSCRGS